MNWIVLGVPAAFLVAFAGAILVEMLSRMLAYRSRWCELCELWNWFSRHQVELDRLLEFGRLMRSSALNASPERSPLAVCQHTHVDDTVPYIHARPPAKHATLGHRAACHSRVAPE